VYIKVQTVDQGKRITSQAHSSIYLFLILSYQPLIHQLLINALKTPRWLFKIIYVFIEQTEYSEIP